MPKTLHLLREEITYSKKKSIFFFNSSIATGNVLSLLDSLTIRRLALYLGRSFNVCILVFIDNRKARAQSGTRVLLRFLFLYRLGDDFRHRNSDDKFVTDVGFFGAQAFLSPEEYRNECLSLAGDELTFAEMEKIFRKECGRAVPLTFHFVSRILMWMMNELGYMFQWFYDSGFGADITALKEIRPDLQTFESWLANESGFVAK
ncbi:hypothetical protein N7468_000932 [Penicillium chermesinum]|uniref:NmrA-like domain-containing protein n=1 Tax=Penicillium chermesinum TaxID=63820 RepID=A0A9W9TY51_9EURO|nr:uncharacterized protein N7468_000932 [Penicillium chermesinum]KAJ5245949.1 hypothetical protein N7468_000932 [Penicillium chermesinum]